MSNAHTLAPRVLACVLAMTVASAVFAQATRNSGSAAAPSGMPEFKDPMTGQVWTPLTVGQDGRPLTEPDDKAFDPKAQNVPLKNYNQMVRGKLVGNVPLTAGARIANVTMDNASLRAVPGQRWQVVMYLNNNSGNPVYPVIECRFTNGGRPVWNTRATVQGTGPGVRQGLVIYGPRADVFVDRAACQVTAPP
jgi:hypothetical protein